MSSRVRGRRRLVRETALSVRRKAMWACTWLPLTATDPLLARSCRWVARALIVDPIVPVAYITIPRVASTSIQTHMLRRAGLAPRSFADVKHALSQLGAYTAGISARDLSHHGSRKIDVLFTVVRHPVDRLVSAFKLFQSNKNMKSQLPANTTSSLANFTDFVLATGRSKADAHWRPQADMLCWILPSLTFVAHLETLDQDLKDNFESTAYPDWPGGLLNIREHTSNGIEIPRLDMSRLAQLRDFYSDDFRLFGYD